MSVYITGRLVSLMARAVPIALMMLYPASAQDARRYTVIQGFVTADRPMVITRSIVTATRLDGKSPESFTVPASGSGFYRFEGLTPGQYRLCAQSQDGVFVDPCDWGGAPVVALNAGDRLPSVPILVQRARLLKVFVANAGVFIERVAASAKADLVVGVRADSSPRQFRPALHVGTAADAYEYRVAVPIGVQVTLEVKSKQLRLQDSIGRDANAASRKVQALDKDAAPFEARFTVAGRVLGGVL